MEYRSYSQSADYCAVMQDDSMEPTFKSGDELFIRAGEFTEAGNGKIIAAREGDTMIVGRGYMLDGALYLFPGNKIVAPWDVIGVVVGYTRHFETAEAPSEAHEAIRLMA